MLDGLGELSYHVYGRDELEKALQVLPQFLDAHEKKWPNSFKMPGFHEALLTNGLPVGLVHFSEIRIDGNPVSWELGFRDSSKAYSYMPAYRNEYSSYSIGKVHLAWLIEDCFQNGLSTFDFMRGAEEYKNDWTDLQADTHRYREFAGGFQSRIKLFADGAIKQVKHLVRLSPIYVFFAEFFRNLSSFLKHEFCSSPELYDVFVEFLAYSVLA